MLLDVANPAGLATRPPPSWDVDCGNERCYADILLLSMIAIHRSCNSRSLPRKEEDHIINSRSRHRLRLPRDVFHRQSYVGTTALLRSQSHPYLSVIIICAVFRFKSSTYTYSNITKSEMRWIFRIDECFDTRSYAYTNQPTYYPSFLLRPVTGYSSSF